MAEAARKPETPPDAPDCHNFKNDFEILEQDPDKILCVNCNRPKSCHVDIDNQISKSATLQGVTLAIMEIVNLENRVKILRPEQQGTLPKHLTLAKMELIKFRDEFKELRKRTLETESKPS